MKNSVQTPSKFPIDKDAIVSFLRQFQPLIALVVMVVAISLMTDSFLTSENCWNIMRQISVNLCLSIGLTLIIITGGIDLSVGAILAFAGAIMAGLLKHGIPLAPFDIILEFTTWGAIISGILAGTTLGAINGVAVTTFRIPPFVATLGMFSIARGLTMLWTGGFPITGLGMDFALIGTGRLVGAPIPVWITLFLVILFVLVTRRTVLGRHIYAIGGNERAALLSGLRVNRIKLWVYTLSGALCGVGAMIVTARLDSAQPNAGLGYELDAIAAVVIGGTSLSGGKGSILGTVLGCLIIGVLNNGLFLLNVSPFWQQIIKGIVILIAVALDRMGRKERP
jgi:ribose transport system permease protein